MGIMAYSVIMGHAGFCPSTVGTSIAPCSHSISSFWFLLKAEEEEKGTGISTGDTGDTGKPRV